MRRCSVRSGCRAVLPVEAAAGASGLGQGEHSTAERANRAAAPEPGEQGSSRGNEWHGGGGDRAGPYSHFKGLEMGFLRTVGSH